MPKKKKKTMVFQASPSESFGYIMKEGEQLKIHTAIGRVCEETVRRYFGEDFEYAIGDIVDWHGLDFEITAIGDKHQTMGNGPSVTLYQVDICRAIMEGDPVAITAESQKKWEKKIKRILNKQRSKEDDEFRLQQIDAKKKQTEKLARARRKKEQLKQQQEVYADKCATSIGGLEI